jgi:hypothetical protein
VQFFDGATSLGSATVTNGVAQLSTSALAVGTLSLTASYSGDSTYNGSTSSAVAYTVAKANSTTAVAASPSPSTLGQSVTLSATVTPAAATGSVQFFYGSTSLGSATVSNGHAQLSTSALPVGTLSLTAAYSGDTNHNGSTSNAVSHTVNRAATTTSLTSNVTPSVYTQAIVLTATVTPASATGQVQFLNGGTLLGTANLSGGTAQITIDTLPVGSNSLTASYAGDASNAPSTSNAFVQAVNKTGSATYISVQSLNGTVGQGVAITATVPGPGVSGSVNFFDGGVLQGSSAISNGQAVFVWVPATAGSHSITASFTGNANYNASTSSPIVITIQKAATTTSAVSSVNPSNQGQAVTFTATVTPASATGSVTFSGIGSAPLVNGVAAITTSSLPAGTTNVTAQYGGNSNYNPSSAPTIAQSVRAATSISLNSSPNPSTFGNSVTLTATVSPSGASGTVSFYDGATLITTKTFSGTLAMVTTSVLGGGVHSLTAVYSGNFSYAPSTSAVRNHTVNKANSTTSLSANPSQSNSGQTVTFTATVTPAGSASGTVQFTDNGVVLATVPLSGNTAAYSTSSLSVATHPIRAIYSGNTDLNSSQSSVLNYRVKN